MVVGLGAAHKQQTSVCCFPSVALCDAEEALRWVKQKKQAKKELDTSLYFAVLRGSTEEVKQALDAGANANVSRLSMTALMLASMRGHSHIVCLLLGPGTSLIAQLVGSKHANPNQKDSHGNTALMEACRRWRVGGTASCIQHLLYARADPNLQNEGGATSLMKASSKGRAILVNFLKSC